MLMIRYSIMHLLDYWDINSSNRVQYFLLWIALEGNLEGVRYNFIVLRCRSKASLAARCQNKSSVSWPSRASLERMLDYCSWDIFISCSILGTNDISTSTGIIQHSWEYTVLLRIFPIISE